MIICAACGEANRIGAFYCDYCGKRLGMAAVTDTIAARQSALIAERMSKRDTQAARFDNDGQLMIYIRDAKEPVKIYPMPRRIIFGRYDVGSTHKPDFDLTPFGALDCGVSRIHAAINYVDSALTLMDMGSSNGTFLNGQQLKANDPVRLYDGDEVHFGQLVTHIYFE